MLYKVSFGTAFTIDQFGFVRKGEIAIEPNRVIYYGNKSWSLLGKAIAFPFIVLLLYLFGIGLFFALPALVILYYYGASDGSLSIKKDTISDIKQAGKKITFKGIQPESGKIKKTIFKVDTEENANKLILELTT